MSVETNTWPIVCGHLFRVGEPDVGRNSRYLSRDPTERLHGFVAAIAHKSTPSAPAAGSQFRNK